MVGGGEVVGGGGGGGGSEVVGGGGGGGGVGGGGGGGGGGVAGVSHHLVEYLLTSHAFGDFPICFKEPDEVVGGVVVRRRGVDLPAEPPDDVRDNFGLFFERPLIVCAAHCADLV